MKISEARKILGIERDLPPQELSILYSNLIRNAFDVKEVIAISTAYILVQRDSPQLHSDLSNVFQVEDELKAYFAQAKEEYSYHVTDIKTSLKSDIERMIDNTRQTHVLKQVVEKDVADAIRYSSSNVSLYLRSLDERLTMNERYSLARIFYPLYKERQAKWLRRFYASRIFKIEILFLILTTTLNHIFTILNIFPSVTKYISAKFPKLVPLLSILSSQVSQYFWDIFTGSLGIAAVAMVIRYWYLGPDHQLITPRLSAQGIRELTGAEAGKITLSDLDMFKRGGIAALAGLVFDPTFIFSTIAATIAMIILIFGESFREKKRKAKESIWEKIRLAFDEVDRSVMTWFAISERIAHRAMIESIVKNCLKLSVHFRPNQFYRQTG